MKVDIHSDSASLVRAASPLANYLSHQVEIDHAIKAVLESGRYILGESVSLLEEEFAGYIGVSHGIGVGSGTDALQIALRACGIGPGDAVITASHTAVATVCAICLTGAHPVLIDVDPRYHTIELNQAEDILRRPNGLNIRAIVPVHMYGHPAEMKGIMDLAERHDLYVIEDCAQAHGALCGNKKVGSLGHFGAFSFYPTKNMGALGDGGAIVTDDPVLAEKARLIRQYGWRDRYVSELHGMNSRLDDLQAAILRVKLRHLDDDNDRRRTLAGLYREMLSPDVVLIPDEREGTKHVYHQYTIRTPRRDQLRAALQARGIETAILYPMPVHLQPAYRDCVTVSSAGLGASEGLCKEILSLPVYPELTPAQVSAIAARINSWQTRAATV